MTPAGGKRVSAAGWQWFKRAVYARAGGMCEVPWCNQEAADAHHIVKRSQGGADDLDNLIALCRPHHDDTDRPYTQGRLVIGPDRRCELVFDPGEPA